MRNIIYLFFSIFFLTNNINAQDNYKYYLEALPNTSSGNPNVIFDKETEHYFFVEWQRNLSPAEWLGGINIKKVDVNGNFISSQYYKTDSHPFSAHFISTIEIQGDDIVIFFNRNLEFSPQHFDSFIFRFNKNLSGTFSSKRYFYEENNEQFNSIQITDSEKIGNKIIFTGSISNTGEAVRSKLLIGIVNEDESIQYQLFEKEKAKVEGLNIKLLKSGFYIGGRYNAKTNQEHPLLIRGKINERNEIEIIWSQVYLDLLVGKYDTPMVSITKGVKIPIINDFDTHELPGFLARDNKGENLVLTLFYPLSGEPLLNLGIYYKLPKDVELIDAQRHSKGTKDAFMALLVRKEQSTFVNTESYMFNVESLFDSTPTWHNMTGAPHIHSALARKFIKDTDKEIAIGLFANTPTYELSAHHRSTLFTSDEFDFNCLGSQNLELHTFIKNIPKKVVFNKLHSPFEEEDRTIHPAIDFPTITENGCIRGGIALHGPSEKKMNESLVIYPNPVTDRLLLQIPIDLIQEECYIQINDITGKLFFEKTIHAQEEKIEMDQLKSGIYILQVFGKKGLIQTERIIKR